MHPSTCNGLQIDHCTAASFTYNLFSQLPRRRGEYLYGVAPCLAALQTGRRQVYNIFLKTAVGSKTSELKRLVWGPVMSLYDVANITV